MAAFWRFLRPSVSLPLPPLTHDDSDDMSRHSESSTETFMTDTAEMLDLMNVTLRHVNVVGARGAGKTTLVQALTTTRVDLLNHRFGMDRSTWEFEVDSDDRMAMHQVAVWDFLGGDDETCRLAAMLTTPRSLWVVCVDAQALLTAATVVVEKNKKKLDPLAVFVDENVLSWVRAFVGRGRQNTGDQQEIALVLTKMDLVEQERMLDVQKKVADHIQRHLQAVAPNPATFQSIMIRWGTVSCHGDADKEDAKTQCELLVVQSGNSMTMSQVSQRVLEAIDDVRAEHAQLRPSERIRRSFVKVTKLIRALRTKIPVLTDAVVRETLHVLHDLGEVLWYDDRPQPLGDVVILDPTVVVDFVRVILQAPKEDRNDEVMPHAILMSLPLWNNIDDVMTAALKQFMVAAKLAHTSRCEVEWDSDLIVPSYWRTHAAWATSFEIGPLTVPNKDVNIKPTKQVQWQYHFVGAIPHEFFEKVLVECYSPLWHRTIAQNGVEFETEQDFACRVVIDQAVKDECVVHLSALSYVKDAPSWWIFQRTAQAIETVLDSYPNVLVSRCALNDDDEPHRLETVVAYWVETSPAYRRTISWLPPDLTWYHDIVTKRETSQ